MIVSILLALLAPAFVSAAAETAYRSALRADPGASHAYGNLSSLLTIQGRSDEAAELAAAADLRSSRDPFAFWRLAQARLDSGRLAEARSYARKALELSAQGAP